MSDDAHPSEESAGDDLPPLIEDDPPEGGDAEPAGDETPLLPNPNAPGI